MTWIEEVTGSKLGDIKDQIDFAELLKDGSVLCSLINCLQPGSVKKINTLKAPFKQVRTISAYIYKVLDHPVDNNPFLNLYSHCELN